MKSTRTMNAPLNPSFANTSFSFRFAGVDRFRLLLKGWGVKVFSLTLVLMVGGSLVGQTTLQNLYLVSKNVPSGNSGWTFTNATVNNATTDYWKMIASSAGSVVLSPSMDFSKYTNIKITISTTSFSTVVSSSDFLKLEYNNGSNWSQVAFGNHSTTYASSISLPYSSSTSQIRLTATNATGTAGARLLSVLITATAQATSITSGTPTTSSIPTLSCTNGTGAKRAIFIAATSIGAAAPVNNTTYTASTTFGSGTQIGSTGWYCVFNNTGTPNVTVTGLNDGTTYRVMVCEYDGTGATFVYNTYNSGSGNPVNFTTTSSTTAPLAPTITSITPSNQQLSIAFTAGGDGGSAITNYKYSTDGGANWQTRAAGTTASPMVISTLSTDGTTALTNGTSYNVQIKAVNAIGDGTATASTAATPRTVPNAPTVGAASVSGISGSASVAFTVPGSNGGAAITGYTVTSNSGVTGTGASSPISVSGLTNGTAYTFTVTATNAAGTSSASSASNSVTPYTVPNAPTIGAATVSGVSGTANVSFTAPVSNGGSAITSYSVTSNPLGGTGSLSQSGDGTITVTGLTNGIAYTFTVKATNAAGNSAVSGASNSVTPYTVPGSPTIGTAVAGNTTTSVSFTIPGSNGGSSITGYTVTSNPDGLTNSGATSPITVSGLTNGTAYTFTVTATNAAGTGSASAASSSVTPTNGPTVPDTPTSLVATLGNASVSVAFTAPFDGGSAITAYTVTSTPGNITGTGSASPVTVNGLTNGIAYSFTAVATNSVGNSLASSASNSVTPATTPDAPTITSITPSNTQLSVAFTAGATGGSVITNYKYSTDGGSTFTAVSPAATTSPITITGLSNGTSYSVQIKAVNAIGDGTATASISATPATTPSAPTISSISSGNGQLSVAFTVGANGGSAITNYKYSINGGSTFTAVSPAATTSPITITGLTNGTSYNVQIKAVNAIGDGTATVSSAGTPATTPSAPTITSITPGNGQLSVNFTAGVTGGSVITNYKYSTDGGTTFTAVSPAATTSPITITGLVNGTSYNVQLKAVNAIGDGTATGSIAAIPSTVPDAPTIGTAAVTGTSGSATVTFTASAFNGGSAITSYSVTSIPAGGSGSINQAGSGTITVTGLTNGTAYTFSVKANNAAGASAASAASNSVTPYTVPGAPSIGTATAGNGQATITFTAPASNGGSTITSYTASSSPGSFIGTLNQAGSGTITVTGLTNGTAYTFTIKANNAAGASVASAASNGVTPVLPAPVANAASSVLVNGFTANWAAVSSGTGYKLDVSTSSNFNTSNTISEGFENVIFPPNGWTNNGWIRSTTASDIISGSGAANANSSSGTLTTSSISYPTNISFYLGRSSNTNSKILKVEISTTSQSSGFTTLATYDHSNVPTSSYDQYTIDLAAYSANNSVYIRFVKTSSTTSPWRLDDVVVNQQTPSCVSGYEDLTVAETSHSVTGLSEGTTYYYRVRATDGSTSASSNVITVTTKQTPTVTSTVGTYTYTGSAQGPDAATNTGTGSTYTFSYSGTGATTYGASSTRPTAAGAYTVTASVAANGNYVAASSSATAFSIAKATPTITVAPTATEILLGQALSTSTLSGGTASPAGGSFAFTSPSTVPVSTGTYSASVTYTPTDVTNYNTATTNTNVQVASPLSTISNTQFTSARDITRGTTELPIYRFQVDVTNVAAALSSLGFTTPATAVNGNSNYVNTDITNFKAFLTTSTTFSNATQLGATSPSGKTQQNAGETLINFTSLATTLNVGTTYYIWLTADVLSAAVAGRTITVNAPTIGISGTVSGTNSATGTQTIISVATNYYLNAGGSLTTSAHYFTSPNGVGTSLSAAGFSYTSNDVTLNIPSSVANTSDFTLGNGSKIVVQSGGSLTVGSSNTITGTIDVNDGGTLTVNNTSISHTLGTLGSTSSTVIYNASGIQAIAAKPYANLTISGSEVKTIGLGTTTVSGTLSLNAGTLDISSNTLVTNGLVSQSSGIIDADTGTLTFGNSADMSLLSTLFSGTIYNLSKSSGAGTLTLNDDFSITNNLSTSTSTGALVLAATKQLTVGGIISNNGTFTIENGATLLQTGTGTNTGSGTYNVKQNITGSGGSTPNGRFWYLGGALSDVSSTALLSSTGNQLWQWNEASFGYAPVTSGQTLSQGKSYVLRSGQAETINFSGSSLSNGTVTVSGLTRTGTSQNYRGCHLVSNPYPSYLDWNAITKSNIGTTMYIRTAIGTTLDVMETFNSSGSIATTISSVPLTQYIAPMQGFWVKVAADGQTGSLTMNNSLRSHQSSGSGLRSTAQDFPAFLRFNMFDGQNKDQVILLMSPDAAMSIDDFDSEKMPASGYAQFYSTVNAKKLVINGMKNVKAKTSVPLTLDMPTSKSYTFQAEEFHIEDGLILLEDKQEGVIQDLTINPTYSFFGNAGTNAARFVVHFQLATAPVLVGGPQELESLGADELTTDNIQIVSNNQGTVIIRLSEGFKPEGSIRIFDASGRLVEQTDFNDQETTIQLNEQAGLYFVEVSAGKLMVKKKIVIE